MKVVKAILMIAIAMGLTSLFASSVSAADQADNQLIVKNGNADLGAVHQTTGQNESGNISKVDLNGVAKPEETISVENTTISEPNKDITDITPVQSVDNSTEIGKKANATDLEFGNSQELTNKGKMSVKTQGWIEDTKKFVDQVGKSFTDNVVVPIVRLLRPEITINASGNNSSWNAYINAHAASKTQRSKKYKK